MWLLITGLVVTGLSWVAAWSRIDFISEYSFFPLWVGYILAINGLSETLFRTSLLRRMRWSFLALFAASIPMWWFFEYMNSIVENWHYVFAAPISSLHYGIQASIDFSTVVPAVLSASFVAFQILRRERLPQIQIRIPKGLLAVSFVLTFVLFALLKLFPKETFPFVWIIPILFLEPLNYTFNPGVSLARLIERGQLALPVSIGLATLVTGFWWELWNYYSLPKWVYTIPYVDFWKIFEMPLLGYFGYPFFGLIVFGYTALVLRVITGGNLVDLFSGGSGSSRRRSA
jgi:hypothetical protein